MADLISGILGGIGALGSLFGGNSAQKEANRLRNRELALQERALQNYEKYASIGQGYRNQGEGYLQKQGGAYDRLGGYGKADRENAVTMLNQYLPQYAKVSGLPVADGTMPGLQFTGGNGYAKPTTGPLAVSPEAWKTPASPLAEGPYNPNEARPGSVGQYQTGLTEAQRTGLQAEADRQTDPYGLTNPQQEQLNQRIDAIRTQEAAAINEYRALLSQQGLPINPAGEARIREQLGGMAAKERSNFAENARAERAAALQNLIALAVSDKQSGNQLLSEQAGGYGNVAAGYGGYANSAAGQGEGGPYQQIANVYAQQSQVNAQRSDDMYQSLGALLPLLADAFKPKKKQPVSTGDWGGEAG